MLFCQIIFFFRDTNETEKLSSPFRRLKLKGKAVHAVARADEARSCVAGPTCSLTGRVTPRGGGALLPVDEAREQARRDPFPPPRRLS